MNNINEFLSFKKIVFEEFDISNEYIDLSNIQNDYEVDINVSFNQSNENEFMIYGTILNDNSNYLKSEKIFINLVEPQILANNLSYRIIEKHEVEPYGYYKFIVNSRTRNISIMITSE